ncbi:NAD(P)-binding protein [Sporormia fimetaria CBS 119925]|uniref:D-xylose 1-dehydrogenase (NADP(+), D-xylono-1,5-lactone-forming) n=1 Tax=Sporormia fimetaria CBS 119925 TaxID=1340428 RepID=A0A6A6V365_9PLEO|nr:NAD(P)-binding protein [Sporormia fimetaria CBS 119925]
MASTTTKPFELRWGILGPGNIAKTFTKDLLTPTSTRNANDITHKLIAAASSSSLDKAKDFLSSISAPSSAIPLSSYTDLVSHPSIDIIYISTPHSHHYSHARLALSAGKHVLCEKPITVNAKQTEALVELAREKGVFLMEAVWTRCFPVSREVVGMVREGKVGEVKRVWADLSYWKDVEGEFGEGRGMRMVDLGLAGGALLDLGIYSLTWVFQALYHAAPQEQRGAPVVASSMTKYPPTGCDEQTSVILAFPNGGHGIATTSLRVAHSPDPTSPTAPPAVRIQATLADIIIPFPCYRPTSYTVTPASNAERGQLADYDEYTVTHEVEGGGHGMFYEADECARCIRDGKLESSIVPLQESVEVMRVMDSVRDAAGLRYPGGLEDL